MSLRTRIALTAGATLAFLSPALLFATQVYAACSSAGGGTCP